MGEGWRLPRDRALTRKDVLVTVLALVFWPLPFQPLVQVLHLLLLQTLWGKRGKWSPRPWRRAVHGWRGCGADQCKRWGERGRGLPGTPGPLPCWSPHTPQTPPRSQPWLCSPTPASCSVPRPGSQCQLRSPSWRSTAGAREGEKSAASRAQKLRGRKEAAWPTPHLPQVDEGARGLLDPCPLEMLHQVREAVKGLRTAHCVASTLRGAESGHLSGPESPSPDPQPQTEGRADPPHRQRWRTDGPPAGCRPTTQMPYLTHDLDMGDSEWGVRPSLGLVAEHRQHKISRLAETFTHEKSPGLTLGLQQCLCLPSRHVAMVPPREDSTQGGETEARGRCWVDIHGGGRETGHLPRAGTLLCAFKPTTITKMLRGRYYPFCR